MREEENDQRSNLCTRELRKITQKKKAKQYFSFSLDKKEKEEKNNEN